MRPLVILPVSFQRVRQGVIREIEREQRRVAAEAAEKQ